MIFNFFKKLNQVMFFSQIDPLIKLGKTKIINETDVIPLAEDIRAFSQTASTEDLNFNSYQVLLITLMQKLKTPLIINFILLVLAEGLSLLSPLLIHKFIDSINKGIHSFELLWSTSLIGASIGLIGYLSGLLMQHYFYFNLKLNQKIISLLNIKIFNHSLLLKHSSRQEISVGDVVNNMSSDSESVADLCFVGLEIISSLIIILVSTLMLFYYIGPVALISVGLFLLLIPISKYAASKFTFLEDQIMGFRDQRLNLMTQILNAIRLVKYFVWEKSIHEEVSKIRDNEVASRRKLVKTDALINVVYLGISSLTLILTLMIYSKLGYNLSLALVFTLISIFNNLDGPLNHLTSLISRFTSGIVGAKRITEFSQKQIKSLPRIDIDNVGIKAQNLSFSYGKKFNLKNLNFNILPGQSLAVVGPVGAGKSTLLHLFLRELDPNNGSLTYFDSSQKLNLPSELPKNVIFVPQESFIINSTLRENLNFGELKLSDKDLILALEASCFDKDLQKFEHGLDTEIGEKGINLSGGQKQRISLARSFLKNPKLILLDDPLSAVDVHTEEQLCDRLIFGAWKDITRIVVTHRLEHLRKFDHILFLASSNEYSVGSLDELLTNNKNFKAFYSNYQKNEAIEHSSISKSESESESNTKSEHSQKIESEVKTSNNHRITVDEEKASGTIKKDLYFSYLKLLGGESSRKSYVLLGLLMSALIAKSIPLGQNAWISKLNTYSENDLQLFFIGFILISILNLSCSYLNTLLWFRQGIQAAVRTHSKMLYSVLHSKIRFFDSTPVGRILQRFSRDQESIDVHLMFTHITAIDCFVQIVISLILIVAAVPVMFLFFIPILLIYYRIQNSYRRVAREVKRLDSIARSPRYAHFKETLQGLTLIRAFGVESWFNNIFLNRLNQSHQMYYNHFLVNRWFSVRVPLIGGLIASTTAIFLALGAYKGYVGPGICGLVLIYAMSFWRQLNWAIRIFSDIEARMTSVERLHYYCELPAEEVESLKTHDSNEAHDKIISKGEIQFKNLNVRYATHLPLVLSDVSFSIRGGERAGIIGRTGSGKSTLFQALYRFVDFESGDILLDGKSLKNLNLFELRRSMAIIPQDPTLFLGTLRSNLDRYGEYSDFQIETVLNKVCLWNFVNSLPLKLQTNVSENGNNFSQGQRQLLCLARALLTKAKIIILDEATASVDIQTDNLIQRILRTDLIGVTQLIIAHRLETVQDCDKIIKLEQGRVVSVSNDNNKNISMFRGRNESEKI